MTLFLPLATLAETPPEGSPEASGQESQTEEAAPPEVKGGVVKKNKGKGKRTRERETEGTEAPNRFEADTVIKSQYRFNGEYLEVDPD